MDVKLWTKDFIIISFVNFFLTLVIYLLLVIMGVYAVETFQATTSQAGLAVGIFVIGILVGRLYIGNKVNVISLKKILYTGLILFTITTSLYLIEYNITILLIIRFLNGFTYGIASTAVLTIVGQIIPKNRKGEGIGFFSLSTILSVAVGPFIGIYFSQNAGYNTLFILCLLFIVGCVITSFFLAFKDEITSEEIDELKGFKISNYIELKVVPIAIIVFILGLAYSSVLTYINFYAIEKNMVSTASLFFIVYAIAILVSRPITGRLMDIKGANFIMYPCFALFAAGLILLSVAPNGIIFLLSSIFIGLGFGNMQSSTQTIAITKVPPEKIGMASSTFFIFFDFGIGFGPYLFGLIIECITYEALYALVGTAILLTAILYYFLHGKKVSLIK